MKKTSKRIMIGILLISISLTLATNVKIERVKMPFGYFSSHGVKFRF